MLLANARSTANLNAGGSDCGDATEFLLTFQRTCACKFCKDQNRENCDFQVARASHIEFLSSVFRMKRAAQLALFLEAVAFAVDEVVSPALSNATIQTKAKPAAAGITFRAAQEFFLVDPPCGTLVRRPVQAAMTSPPRAHP